MIENEVNETDEHNDDQQIETEAKSMGWSPKEKWRGDPERWVDAREYKRRAQEHLPIVQGLLSREKEERARDKQQYDRRFEALQREFDQRLKATGSMAETAIRRIREQHLTDLELERRRIATSPATPEQRAQQFEHVTRAEQDLLKQFRDEDAQSQEELRKARPAPVNDTPPEVLDWGTRNSWFYALKQANSPIAQEAEAIHMMLNQQGVPLKDNLEEVTRRMSQRYPHIVNPDTQPPARNTRNTDYGDDDADEREERRPPARTETRRPSSVEGQSNGRAQSRTTVKGWRDIPASERDMMTTSFISNGLYGDPEKDGLAKVQAKAAAAYWSQYPEG